MSDMLIKAARALCLVQFGDESIHGDARCCQAGGSDGCCVDTLLLQANAIIEVARETFSDVADRHSYEAAQAIRSFALKGEK
jgi:hypothetical protein